MPPSSQPVASSSRPGRAAQSRPLPEAVMPSSRPPLPPVGLLPPAPLPPVPPVHVPMVLLIEEQVCPDGQPLPGLAWQPGSHIPVVVSQTWPLVVSPQFASVMHCTHMPMALVVEVQVSAGVVGQPLPPVPRQPGSQVWVVVLQTWPLVETPQSESCEQPGPQAPVVVLQMSPAGSPAQSALVMHLPQVPAASPLVKQCGVLLSAHGSVAVEPRSPLQGTQVELVASQIDVVPRHAEAFEAVHWTQVFAAPQAGLAPLQALSVRQATQSFAFWPEVAQRPLMQTRAPAAMVQVPFSVGPMCGGSFGTGVPFASFGMQTPPADSSHQSAPGQSASTEHSATRPQTPLGVHVPERQTTSPLLDVQEPSPFA
jgi:hypothetical protein